ncbi:MAG TPA: glutaminyl-peptide cyclotransferase [Gammaproteobacteria bacterium]|nr:glutaminyl-peptide cyclotransferase [Gammaproteobacteria bacterium]
MAAPDTSSQPLPAPPARGRLRWLVPIAVAAVVAVGVAAWAQIGARHAVETSGFKVVAVYPHDPRAFTQGLVIRGGRLYEGTGQYGQSTLRRVDLATGNVEKSRPLAPEYFGEGVAVLGNKIYQLTWKNGAAFVYDLESFNVEKALQYKGEGWGLTDDGEHLIMSDGTATIRFLDPATFATVRTIAVHDGDMAVDKLNELEFINGEIWSNVWYDDRIARISPADGAIVGWIDLSALYPKSARGSEAVLNGIAYDTAAKKLYVTGKNWPQLYEIELARK